MSRKYSEDEKREFVLEALQDFREAQKMVEQGRKLMKRAGAEFTCGTDVIDHYFGYTADGAEGGMMLYSGIRKLAKLFGVKAEPMKDWEGKPARNKISINVAGIILYQLGDETKTNFKFR